MSKNVVRGRGRPAKFETKKTVVEVLRNDVKVSYYHKRQLVKDGYFVASPIKSDNRGRPAFAYELTAKGRNLLRLSQNWGRHNVVKAEPLDYIVIDCVNNNFDPIDNKEYAYA